MDWLGGITPLAQLSATGALLLVGFLVFLGQLVPKRTVDTLLKAKDAEIAGANERAADWRAAHATSEAAREIITTSNRELIEITRTFGLAASSGEAGGHVGA